MSGKIIRRIQDRQARARVRRWELQQDEAALQWCINAAAELDRAKKALAPLPASDREAIRVIHPSNDEPMTATALLRSALAWWDKWKVRNPYGGKA